MSGINWVERGVVVEEYEGGFRKRQEGWATVTVGVY